MSSKRYTDEVKIEAMKQVTDRGQKVARDDGNNFLRSSWAQRYGEAPSCQTGKCD